MAFSHEARRQTSKTNCFADDATVITKLNLETLSTLKQILLDFAAFSGLKCNLDKTFLIPIGADTEIGQNIRDVGFSVVSDITLLGITTTRNPDLLRDNFSSILGKIKKQFSFWERFNLSLAGRIRICKCLLVSQINYLGAICSPSDVMLADLQSTLNKYCVNKTKMSKDRLYLSPGPGGLGLIDLRDFLNCQKSVWVFRANKSVRDNWQFDLFHLCNNNILSIAATDIDALLHPILYDLTVAFTSFKQCHERLDNNFLLAPVLNNPRDDRHLDYEFFHELCADPNFSVISRVAYRDLFLGNRFKMIGQLELVLGTPINNDVYLLLRNAFNYFKLYHHKQLSLTSVPVAITHYSFIKKPGVCLRRLLANSKKQKNIVSQQNIKTFCNVTDLAWPDNFCFKTPVGCWNINYLPCRFVTFLFKFINNSLGLNTRVSHFDNLVNRTCTLCRVSNVPNVQDETFLHLFFTCPISSMWRTAFEQRFLTDMLLNGTLPNPKQLWFTGKLTCNYAYKTSLHIAVLYFQYSIWECKLQQKCPSFNTIAPNYTFEIGKLCI